MTTDIRDAETAQFPRQPVLQQRRKLERGPVLITAVGLQMPSDLSFEEWERAGRKLAGVVDSSSWWLGDWLVYGTRNYTDRYQWGIRTAGLKYQTLRNYAWVSRRFELHRRRTKLTFQHHAEVASLPVEEQERWLNRTEQNSWTTKQLRNNIQDAGNASSDEMSRPDAARRIAVPGSRIQWWHRAAEHSGIDFENWVLATLDSAAESILKEAELPTDTGA